VRYPGCRLRRERRIQHRGNKDEEGADNGADIGHCGPEGCAHRSTFVFHRDVVPVVL